jgi:hypothetical protein
MFSTRTKATVAIATLATGLCLTAAAQEPNPTTIAPGAKSANIVADTKDGIYIFHVKTVERQLDAVNYFNRSGSTHVAFTGTDLMPAAKGDAKVNAVTGKTNIDVHFEGRRPPAEPRRARALRRQGQPQRHHRLPVLRHDRHRRTLLRRLATLRRRRPQEHFQRQN